MLTTIETTSRTPVETPAALVLPDPIRALLAGVRRRIRAYVWLEGLSLAAIWLGAAFWLSLAVDWAFEPPAGTRFGLVGVAAAGLVALLYVSILRRAFARLSPAELAVLLERRFAQFGDRLVTAVELVPRSGTPRRFDPSMLARTTNEAAALGRGVPVGRLFNRRRLAWRAVAAASVAASVAAFALAVPDAFAFWIERLKGSPEPWPRDTLLTLEGFHCDFVVVAEPEAADGARGVAVHVYRGGVEWGAARNRRETIPAGAAQRRSAATDEPQAIPLVPRAQLVRPFAGAGLPSAANLGDLAVVRRAAAARWQVAEGDDPTPSPGATVGRERIVLVAGAVELALAQGASLSLVAPAEFALLSSHQVELHRGAMAVHAPTRHVDFTVLARGLRIAAVRQDTVKVVRGGDVRIVAQADALRTVPQLVEVRYRTAAGARGSEIMQQEAAAVPGRDPFQRFAHSFKNVLSPIEFEVVGGDDRVGNLRIEPVDSPKFVAARVDCRFPEYLVDPQSRRFAPRTLPVAGPVELPQGTQVTLRAAANKPLSRVEVRRGGKPSSAVLHLPRSRPSPESFTFDAGVLSESTTLLVTLLDADGIANREPIPVELIARPDSPPVVTMRPRGIGAAITPDAVVRFVGEITDDYELSRAWFQVQRGDDVAAARELAAWQRGRQKAAYADEPSGGNARTPARRSAEPPPELDFRRVRLPDGRPVAPGDQLVLSVKAADRSTLAGGPNVGEGDRHHVQVVRPEELLALLEAREFMLRQKFEAVISELTQTRDALALLPDQAPPDQAHAAARPMALSVIERTAQNVQRSRYETLALAAAFEEIRAELASNRLDTRERSERLLAQIAQPLRRIGDRSFPPLEESVRRLRDRAAADPKSLANPQELPTVAGLAGACRDQMSAILAEMRSVLARMRELEDFNQLIDKLRKLMEDQEEINRQTRKLRRADLED